MVSEVYNFEMTPNSYNQHARRYVVVEERKSTFSFWHERLRKVKFGEGGNMSLWGVATASSKILCEMS